MRDLMVLKASDKGELSGAAVDTRISVWAWAAGKANAVAKKTAVAMKDRLMVRS
jgi:hypothetical protein